MAAIDPMLMMAPMAANTIGKMMILFAFLPENHRNINMDSFTFQMVNYSFM